MKRFTGNENANIVYLAIGISIVIDMFVLFTIARVFNIRDYFTILIIIFTLSAISGTIVAMNIERLLSVGDHICCGGKK